MIELFKFSQKKYTVIKYKPDCPIPTGFGMEEDNIEYEDRVRSVGYFLRDSSNHSEEDFLKNYGNPLYTVSCKSILIVLQRVGPKLSLKLYQTGRKRNKGTCYFIVHKECHFLTINIEKGDYYYGKIVDYHKKRKFYKTITKNVFSYDTIKDFKEKIKHSILETSKEQNQYPYPDEELINKLEIPNIVVEKMLKEITPSKSILIKDPIDQLMIFYFNKKGIKYPNNYRAFYMNGDYLKVNLKLIRKHNLNLVDAFMSINDLKGQKIKKILHQVERINLSILKPMITIFGYDKIVNDEVLLNKIVSKSNLFLTNLNIINIKNFFSKKELNNLYLSFRYVFLYENLDIITLNDHVDFYVMIKNHLDDSIKWSPHFNREEFMKEHLDWSEKVEFLRNGKYKRIYPQYFYDTIQPYEINKIKYFPILLDDSSGYNEETKTQSNCVKTYIGKTSSLIVSLRRHSKDSTERATVEYRISKNLTNKLIVNNIQTRGRYNYNLEESWSDAVNHLDKIISKLVEDKRYETVKIEKVLANGMKLFSDSDWRDNTLVWTYNDIVY